MPAAAAVYTHDALFLLTRGITKIYDRVIAFDRSNTAAAKAKKVCRIYKVRSVIAISQRNTKSAVKLL